MLSRFTGIGENQTTLADDIVEALTLVNDIKYRKTVDDLNEKIDKESDPQKKADLVAQRDANAANIQTPELKKVST